MAEPTPDFAQPDPYADLARFPAAIGGQSAPAPAVDGGDPYASLTRTAPPAEARPGVMSRAWNSLTDMVTGDGSTEFPAMPELTQSGAGGPLPGGDWTEKGVKLTLGYLAAGGKPEAMADIARKTLPGSTVSQDRFGNPILTYQGRSFYVNKPGASVADLDALMVPTAVSIAAGGVAGAGARALGAGARTLGAGALQAGARGAGNMLVRMGAQGIGQAVASLGDDAAAVGLGSEQGVSGHDALWAGAGGAMGEPIATAAGALGGAIGRQIGAAWGRLWGYRGNLLGGAADSLPAATPLTDDMLTRTGRAVLGRTDNQPGDFTVGQMRAFQDIVGRSGKELREEAVRIGQRTTAQRVGDSVRTGIPMTTGQATGQELGLALEDRLRNTAPTKEIFDRFKAEQGQAVNREAGRLVPGSQPGMVPDEAMAGADLAGRLQARQAQLARATTDAYARLPSLTAMGMAAGGGPSVTYNSGVGANILARMRQLHMGQHIQDDWGQAQRARELIAQAVTVPAEGEAAGAAGVAAMTLPRAPDVTPAPFNLGAADSLLRDLGGTYSAAKTSAEKRVIHAMTQEVHGAMDAARMNGLISGDENLIGQWQAARASRRDTGVFMAEGDPIVNKFMDRATSGELSGQEIINGLYGASEIGGGRGTLQVLNHLRGQYGTGSPEWQAVRTAAAKRMIYGGKAVDVPGQDIPGIDAPGRVVTRLNNALTGKGRELSQTLFTPAELAELATYRDALQEVVKGNARNPSGTAYALQNMNTAQDRLGRLMRRWRPTAWIPPDRATGEDAAREAIAGRLTPDMWRAADSPLGVFARRGWAPIAGGLLGRNAAEQ